MVLATCAISKSRNRCTHTPRHTLRDAQNLNNNNYNNELPIIIYVYFYVMLYNNYAPLMQI
jgi:hypothetical protein